MVLIHVSRSVSRQRQETGLEGKGVSNRRKRSISRRNEKDLETLRVQWRAKKTESVWNEEHKDEFIYVGFVYTNARYCILPKALRKIGKDSGYPVKRTMYREKSKAVNALGNTYNINHTSLAVT